VTDLPDRVLENLRALGADVDRLPAIPKEVADYIARLMPKDVKRIRRDARELERLGLLPKQPLGTGVESDRAAN
jgi:hypothetical protein